MRKISELPVVNPYPYLICTDCNEVYFNDT